MPYGGGQSGMGGASGMVMSLPDHDKSLVTVIEEKKARRRDINVVTPVAGKTYAFDRWKKSLKQLPLSRCHTLIYDNSNNNDYSRKVQSFCKRSLDSFTYVKDQNQQLTAEMSRDWVNVGSRCRSIYIHIYNDLLDRKRPVTVNLEDDIGVPDGAWNRLSGHLDMFNDVATVIPQCFCRRAFFDKGIRVPIAVNFKVTQTIGQSTGSKIETSPIEIKDFGVESIGGGHMGFWLTKTEVLNDVPMGICHPGLRGNDINWGYSVNDAGWRFVIDWGVKLDHYYEKHGKLQSC